VIVTWQNLLSLSCLLITGALATWGVFSRHFDDSLLQRIGLAVLAMACILRVPDKLAPALDHVPPALLMAQVGLAIYAVGTAGRLYRQGRGHRTRARPAERGHYLRAHDVQPVKGGRRSYDFQPSHGPQ
jgi:hypothetical protein